MSIPEIERSLRALRLSGIAATLNTRLMQAQAAQQPFLETLVKSPACRNCVSGTRFESELRGAVRTSHLARLAAHRAACARIQ